MTSFKFNIVSSSVYVQENKIHNRFKNNQPRKTQLMISSIQLPKDSQVKLLSLLMPTGLANQVLKPPVLKTLSLLLFRH